MGFCTGDVLNCIRTKTVLKQEKKDFMYLGWKVGGYPPFSLEFDWPLLEPEAAMLVM